MTRTNLLDSVSRMNARAAVCDRTLKVPVFYYTQLLGLAMELKQEKLGLELNQSPIDSVLAQNGGT